MLYSMVFWAMDSWESPRRDNRRENLLDGLSHCIAIESWPSLMPRYSNDGSMRIEHHTGTRCVSHSRNTSASAGVYLEDVGENTHFLSFSARPVARQSRSCRCWIEASAARSQREMPASPAQRLKIPLVRDRGAKPKREGGRRPGQEQ